MTAAVATPPDPSSGPNAVFAPRDAGRHSPPRRLRVVVRPAPQREPPFDDECADIPVVTVYDRRLPFVAAPDPTTPVPLGRTLGMPDPAAFGRRLLIALIEVADGRRPLRQLGSLLTFSVVRGLGSDFERAVKIGQPHWLRCATVRNVRGSEPADGVAELCATVDTGPRVRAAAMRLEREGNRWRCTRLQLG